MCDGCGARLRSNYIRTHQRKHCHGREAAEEEDDVVDNDGEVVDNDGEEPVVEEDLHVDEVLAIVNDLDQTILGGGVGGRDEAEEEETLALQRRLHQQRMNAERTPPPDLGILSSSSSSSFTLMSDKMHHHGCNSHYCRPTRTA